MKGLQISHSTLLDHINNNYLYKSNFILSFEPIDAVTVRKIKNKNRTEQNRTEQNRTEQNKKRTRKENKNIRKNRLLIINFESILQSII